tara:strand:+ start:13 stop:579 length:567 start_codon:yes stop_codon:yes gene_type:complete
MSILENMEKDGQDGLGVQLDDGELKTIAELAEKQASLEAVIKNAEAQLKGYKEELKQVAEVQLPEALQEVGVSEFSLIDGTRVSVTPFYSARITMENKEEAFDWLRTNGHADLIKNTVSVSFGRAEDDTASSLLTKLDEDGFHPEQKEWVEPMTLKGFVREQVEKGNDLPFDTLNIYVGQKTKITKGN